MEHDYSANDPELSGKYLGTITRDFVKVSDQIREASYQIRKRGFSDFPIFPVSKADLPFGQLLFGRKEMDLEWNYYASYLKEFVEARIIDKSREEEFMKVYKDPDEFCCLFVVDRELTSFVYVPYPVD